MIIVRISSRLMVHIVVFYRRSDNVVRPVSLYLHTLGRGTNKRSIRSRRRSGCGPILRYWTGTMRFLGHFKSWRNRKGRYSMSLPEFKLRRLCANQSAVGSLNYDGGGARSYGGANWCVQSCIFIGGPVSWMLNIHKEASVVVCVC